MGEIKKGDTVTANSGIGCLGLPYRATIEEINGDRAKVRPLHPTLTAGSARSADNGRKGASLRARWVKLSSLRP